MKKIKSVFSMFLTMLIVLSCFQIQAFAANRQYDLKINTNNKGTVTLQSGKYTAGETLNFTVVPNVGYYLDKVNESHGEVKQIGNYTFEFVMPSQKTTLTFVFKNTEQRTDKNY